MLATPGPTRLSWLQRRVLASRMPSRLRGRIVGIGFRPEHVRTPERRPPA